MDAVLFFEGWIKKVFGQQKTRAFESKLLLNNSRMHNLHSYVKWSILEGIAFMIACMVLAAEIAKTKPDLFAIAGLMAFFAPFCANYLFVDILFERRKRKKEELLSDLLLEASVFCDEASMEQTIRRLSEQDFPLLREDFHRAYQEIKNGASIEEALQRTKELNQSKAFSRVIDLLLQGYRSGAQMGGIMKETAEDLLETKAIIRERQAVMLVTKYTLILASGIIVPAVLGLIIGLVSGMNFDSMGELALGLGTEERKELFKNAISGTTIYVFEYAALSSFFLALQEGNKKQFWIYALVLVPIAAATFFTARAL